MDGLFDSEYCFEEESILGLRLKLKPRDAGQIDSQMHLTLWPAATELCHQVEFYLKSFPASFILELGAGTGLVGIYISLRHLGQVLITDGVEESVALINENISNNSSPAKAQTLLWGGAGIKSDLIVCSDVVYSLQAVPALLATIKDSLNPSSKCVISNHSIRFSNYEKHFLDTCETLGLSARLLEPISDQHIKTFELMLINHE